MHFPEEILLLIGQGYDNIVKDIIADPDNHIQNIVRLSKVCKVKLTFKCPIPIYQNRHSRKIVSEYVFSDFFTQGDLLYYKFKVGGRSGILLSLDNILKYEPAGGLDKFKDFDTFKKKFDSLYVTDQMIKSLWGEKSSQTGESYKPSDFKPLSSGGKSALKDFNRRFLGVSSTDDSRYSVIRYDDSHSSLFMRACKEGTGGSATSRDISITHTFGNPCVNYASEYSGTGNGRYGMIANSREYLWLEDD
jgi:hypothetical protein